MTYQQITLEERSMISGYCQSGFLITEIAKKLKRHKSTISREIKRNSGKRGYRPKQADEKANERRITSLKSKRWTKKIEKKVLKLLKREWSPEQISDYFKKHSIASISHQRIYQFVEMDKISGGILFTYLRQGKNKRRKKYGKISTKRGQIRNRVSIKERPLHVETRHEIGHWEGDTIIGKNHKKAMITLIERKSGFSIIEKVNSKKSELVADKIIKAMTKYKNLVKSITFDNGLEFAGHEMISKALNCKIYFAEPYSSWQRGTNENTNGLIRQYFPKGSDFNNFTNSDIRRGMDRLNSRPRKRLDYKTPYEIFLKKKVALIT